MESKACPFCNSSQGQHHTPDCYFGPYLKGGSAHAAAWNRRPIEDAQQKRIAELEDNLNALQTKCMELEDDQHELLQDNASLDAELCSSGQHVAELEAQNLQLCKFETFGTRFDGVVNDLLKAESEQDKEVE